MKISVLCSNPDHPVYEWLQIWCKKKEQTHKIELVNKPESLSGGDVLFLISCVEYIFSDIRDKYGASLVIHASNLPEGRGWSPLVWQVLEDKNEIVVSLLEADDSIDSGRIWARKKFFLEGHELVDEINNKLFKVELELMDYALDNFEKIKPEEQKDENATYYRKREPEDSRVDPERSIASQFDLLRVCDPERYPAFFSFRGCEYEIKISKRKDSDHE